MSALLGPTTLGRTGLTVSRIGLGSSYGLDAAGVEHAFERGINYFYWGSRRRPSFGAGIRRLAEQNRSEMVVVVQSYTRVASLMRPSVERALRKLKLDYADLLLLGWWNAEPPARILDAARALRDAGRVHHLMVSCHHRPTFQRFIASPDYGAIMVRYNAAHPGAEREVFPHLADTGPAPGVVAYTATRWGALLDPQHTPAGERTPRASDCYRFALTNPHVDMTLAGPASRAELDEALEALDRGPLDDDELSWMLRVGHAVHESPVVQTNNRAMQVLDRVMAGPRS